VRKKAAIVLLLVALCYILGLVSAFYLPIRTVHLDGVLVRLLGGKVPPFAAKRTFKETLWYVTDRKEDHSSRGKVRYLGEYSGDVSHGRIKVEIPEDRELGSLVGASAIKNVEPISPAQFVKSLQQQSAKPVIIWIHGYKTSFNNTITTAPRSRMTWTWQLPDKIDLVDVSYFEKKYTFMKHRIYQERPVLEDLFWLIQDDYPAAKRYLVKFGGNQSPIDYWVIPP
jgi:hypothetical protein